MKADKLEAEASELESEFYAEMSSTETRHSVGWREDRLKRIKDLRDEARRLKYGK